MKVIVYHETITLAVEDYIKRGFVDESSKNDIINFLDNKVTTWARGYHSSSFKKEGRSLGDYLDYRIEEFLVGVASAKIKDQETLRHIYCGFVNPDAAMTGMENAPLVIGGKLVKIKA